MTAAVVIPSPALASRRAVRAVAWIEARRHLCGLPLWVGLVGLTYFAWITGRQEQGHSATYTALPFYCVPLATAAFIAGVRSAGRDSLLDLPHLAEDAPLGLAERSVGRLLGMAPFVIAATLMTVAIGVGIRIEGGLWVGEGPGRTDAAVHTVTELLQPIALVAFAAAAGVAAGRSFRHRGPILVLGVIVAFMSGVAWWAFQFLPMGYVTLLQTAPTFEYAGPAGTDPSTFPSDWLLDRPGQYSAYWMRVVVDQGLVGGHVVYLLGLAALCVAAALRGTAGRRWLWAGVVIVVVGVAVQVVATGTITGDLGPGQSPL